jgi:5'-nucleotidase
MDSIAVLGTLAALCTTGAFVPQIWKIHKQGGEDLSYGMLGVYLVGVLLWLAFGVKLGAQAVIWANTTAAILVLIAIVMKKLHSSRAAQIKDASVRAARASVPVVIPPPAGVSVATAAGAGAVRVDPSGKPALGAFPRWEKRRPRIAVDMDEVIADAFGKMLRSYNAATGSNVTAEELSQRGTDGTMTNILTPEMRAEFERLVQGGEFFADLELMEGSQEALRRLSESYEIFIASAAMDVPSSFDAKYRWLQQHFSFIPPSHYVFCGDKSILLADYLIDDRPRHFERFAGTGILFTAPHNARRDAPLRADNWADVVQILEAAAAQRDGV